MNNLNDYVNWKLVNTDKLTDASGYPLVLEKCKLNKKMKEFKVYGNTVDDTSIGNLSKNLIWGAGTRTRDTCTTSCSGSVFTYDGACTANISYKSSMYDASQSIILKANTKYTFSIHYISGEFISGVNGLVIGLFSSAGSWVVAPSRYVNTYQYTWSSTFTVQEDTSVSLNVIGWGEFDNLKMGVQLEESDAMTDYEPYGYKIPVVQRGKNRLDFTDRSPAYATLIEETDNSVTYKGSISTVESQYNASPGWIRFGHKYGRTIKVIAGTPITISADVTPIEKHDETRTTATRFQLFVRGNENDLGFSPEFPLELGVKSHITYTFTPTRYDGGYLYVIFYLCSHTMKIENFQIEYGDVATEYEPYAEPVYHDIYLNSPLGENEYIDFKQKKVLRTAGEEDVVCELPKLTSKTTIFETDTSVLPSNMYGKYVKR